MTLSKGIGIAMVILFCAAGTYACGKKSSSSSSSSSGGTAAITPDVVTSAISEVGLPGTLALSTK